MLRLTYVRTTCLADVHVLSTNGGLIDFASPRTHTICNVYETIILLLNFIRRSRVSGARELQCMRFLILHRLKNKTKINISQVIQTSVMSRRYVRIH